ncbi:ferredoxin-NADP reductase [Streptomyces sp. V4I23]|uniref:PDR/VanB family oxidoreductase n=1 Tax=Streptomyces sp. V4I23 TaxID=3042282 RepID=UPI00278131DE|nr:PDR/VanB family oxidoreductase [Streptomyces sp. V4I23]MDQ1006422.1 ferredoxin-NADP reductase [Streptomyces sp. V4I23]
MSRHRVPAPPDLYGRGRSDRLMRFLAAFSDVYLPVVSKADRYGRRPPRPAATSLELVVAARATEAEDVVSLRLTAPDCSPLPRWQAGAHIDLCLPSGRVRQYSLCGTADDRYAYRIAVRRIAGGGGGSVEVHDALPVGSRVTVKGPRNAFPFAAEPAVLFLAGGIGITPVLPMAREAARLGLDWRLIHTGRSRASLPFAAELGELAALGGDRVEILPDDEHGVPDGANLLGRAPAGAAVYCCGPGPLLDSVRGAFDGSGASALHFERFTAAPVLDGRPFELRLRRSGEVLPVPADRSVLDVLLERDPATPYSCRQGFCGVCTQRVTSGTAEHRDGRLTERQRADGRIRVCVSRAPEGSRLELDM